MADGSPRDGRSSPRQQSPRSPRQQSPRQQRSADRSPGDIRSQPQEVPADAPNVEKPSPEVASPAPKQELKETVKSAEKNEDIPEVAPPVERELIKREVVRVDAAWLKRKKGNPNLNPRGFQVICTLTGAPDPNVKKGSVPKPLPVVKDKKEPPRKNIAVDVKEYPDGYMFVADVPGLRHTDIKIDVVNDKFMTISCARARKDDADVSYISLERTMGSYVRKFTLPANSNLDAMKAGCQDGILTVFVPILPSPAEHVPQSFDVAFKK